MFTVTLSINKLQEPFLSPLQYQKLQTELLDDVIIFVESKLNNGKTKENKSQKDFETYLIKYLQSALPNSTSTIDRNTQYNSLINSRNGGKAVADEQIHDAVATIFELDDTYLERINELKTHELKGTLRKYIWSKSLTSETKVKKCMFSYFLFVAIGYYY